MAENGALVRVTDLHKVFSRGLEKIDVLQSLSLEVPEGEFLALMGSTRRIGMQTEPWIGYWIRGQIFG